MGPGMFEMFKYIFHGNSIRSFQDRDICLKLERLKFQIQCRILTYCGFKFEYVYKPQRQYKKVLFFISSWDDSVDCIHVIEMDMK